MRRPIHIQLLVPMLAVVVLAITLVSIANAYLGMERAGKTLEDTLHRVVMALREATFPLTQNVLHRAAELSGAEFVLLDRQGRPRYGTLSLDPEESKRLAHIPETLEQGGFSESSTIELGGRVFLSDRVSLAQRGDSTATDSLVVLYRKDRWWAATREAAYPALLAGVVAVVVAIVITTWLAHRFVLPIQQLRRQVSAVADGDFRPVQVVGSNDEIRDLAASVNQMAEQLGRYEVEVRRNEQLRTLGQLGAGMAHQLRNSATGAAMAIDLHREECPAGPQSESLDVARRQLKLMESYLQRFLTLGKSRPATFEELSLDALVEEVMELVEPTCRHARINLQFSRPDEPIHIEAARDSLRQLLVNLLLNAVEAASRDAPERGRVRLGLARLADDRVELFVEDSGPGPAETTRERLFDPFVTEKPEGTGLGLFVARQAAEVHHGTIRWERREGMTRFIVELPVSRAEEER